MKVRAVQRFTAFLDGEAREIQVGDVLEMPEGRDWLRLGMVVPELTQMERAVVQWYEKRTTEPTEKINRKKGVKNGIRE